LPPTQVFRLALAQSQDTPPQSFIQRVVYAGLRTSQPDHSDRLKNFVDGKKDLFAYATYDWAGNDLQGRALYLDECPWSARVFALTRG
jgi:hypothetical protein